MAWELLYGVGALALLAALAYGLWSYKTRNKANDAITEKATHDLYHQSAEASQAEKADLEQRLR